MKILVTPDIHGMDLWKRIIDLEKPNKVIFLGDYVDSFNIPWDRQIANLLDIVKYKADNEDSTILMVGNHDLPYCPGGDDGVSGYQFYVKEHYESIYKDLWNLKWLEPCHVIDNLLFCHAGITKTWCDKYLINQSLDGIKDLLYDNIKAFEFQYPNKLSMSYSGYGDNIWQSPTWVRPYSLESNKIDNFTQIVGHTVQKELKVNNNVYYCDTFQTSKEYLVIEDNKLTIKKLD